MNNMIHPISNKVGLSERIKKTQSEYRKSHLKLYADAQKRYYIANSEKKKANMKDYYQRKKMEKTSSINFHLNL